MKITFDPAKDQANKKKHGVPLSDAKYLEWDDAIIDIDSRNEYEEVREIG
ncbi:MAG: hypothetical protein NVS3B3_10440 [Aquirhabdus sp.]